MGYYDNAIKCVEYLVGIGFRVQAACGISGNLHEESCCRPTTDSGEAIGIMQWTRGARTDFLTWCANNNRNWEELETQLDYLIVFSEKRYRWQNMVDGDVSSQYGSVTHIREFGYRLDLVDFSSVKTSDDMFAVSTSFLGVCEDCIYSWTAEYYGRGFREWCDEQVNKRYQNSVKIYEAYMERRKITMANMIEFPDYSQRQNPQASLMTHVTWGMTCYEGGCGEMAITDGAKADPCEVWKWMCAQGYVLDDQGTTYDGMISGMKKYMGSGSLLTPSYISGQISGDAYDKLEEHLKSGYCAILLMGGIPRGCRTNGHATYGHYEFACGYDNGNVLIHDSVDGFRTGWHGLRDATSLYGLAGNIKLIFLCDVKWKADAKDPVVGDDRKTCYTMRFRQVEPGMKDMVEIFILEELLAARGYYDCKKHGLDFSYDKGRNLQKAVGKFQKDNGLEVDYKVGVKTWRKLLNMTGTIDGTALVVILRFKYEDGTGTTVTFVESVLKARGFYDLELDKSNGQSCQKAIKSYKEKVMKVKDPNGCITLDLLNDICGGAGKRN